MRLLLAALLLGRSLALGAQTWIPPLMPDDFPVNSHTTTDQTAARMAMSPDGSFVVVWYSHEVPGHLGVWARLFDANASPLGEEFQVSEATAGDQYQPAVARDPDGNFIVVWQSTFQDGSQLGIYGRRYVAGLPTSGEFQVNTETTGDQKFPAVATSWDGSFVVVWETDRPDLAGADILGQRFDASAAKAGPEFQVNTYTPGAQERPAVSMDSTGAFVVTWQGTPSDDPLRKNVFARQFASDGTPLADPFQVTTTLASDQPASAVAVDPFHPRFVVVWESTKDTPPFATEIRGRVFSDGVGESPDFAVSESSDANQIQPSVSMVVGAPLAAWHDSGDNQLLMRRFDALDRPGSVFPVHAGGGFAPSVAENGHGRFAVTWLDFFPLTSGIDVFGRLGGAPDAIALNIDRVPSSGSSDLNGILESGETAVLAPAYLNSVVDELPLTGSLVPVLPGPVGSTSTVTDATADYGVLPAEGVSDCGVTGNCYEISVGRPAAPIGHWDAPFLETLSNGETKTWYVHVGETFGDVLRADPFYPYIETAVHNGVTAGCGTDAYCSANSVTRAQMAVFLLKSRYGSEHVPVPATGTVFGDVPADAFAAAWIEELAALGVTGGCGNGNYCPGDPVTRAQMAVFLLKARLGADYAPPQCTGVFADVSCPSQFADWIEDLAARSITGGCGGGNYCPGSPSTRGQMAVFLTKTFNLPLYGP